MSIGEHRHCCITFEIQGFVWGKKPIVSVTYENERISITNSSPYIKCVLRLSFVVHGPIYGRFMGCTGRKSARKPHRKGETHKLNKVSRFLFKSFYIRKLGKLECSRLCFKERNLLYVTFSLPSPTQASHQKTLIIGDLWSNCLKCKENISIFICKFWIDLAYLK